MKGCWFNYVKLASNFFYDIGEIERPEYPGLNDVYSTISVELLQHIELMFRLLWSLMNDLLTIKSDHSIPTDSTSLKFKFMKINEINRSALPFYCDIHHSRTTPVLFFYNLNNYLRMNNFKIMRMMLLSIIGPALNSTIDPTVSLCDENIFKGD